ncbi:MAG: response regulator transcription factor, partial [Duodenibacillus sp.]
PVDTDKLLAAVEAAVQHDRKSRAGVDGAERIRDGIAQLSEREKEILMLFLRGLTDRMVADRLQISERTVQGHRARIYGKFRVHTARELELLYGDITACLRAGA